MPASKKDDDDDEDDEEDEEEDEEKKKKTTTSKKKSSPDTNVTYFGGINITDKRRTQLAYVSVALSLTGLVLAVLLFVNGLREDNYLSDFGDMVKGYSGGGIFTMMMVIGAAAGLIQLLGCHVCFRVTISVERKKLYYWMWMYMMALSGLLIAFIIANLVGLIYWLSANSAFKGGVHDSMKLYESRLKVKSTIDRMQIDFQCCGSTNYKDWWHVGWWGVRWLDTTSREVQKKMKDGRTYLTDSVPFSCCDPRVRRPCVHHNMLNSFQHTKYDSSNVTVYEIGCTQALSNHYANIVSSFLKLLFASFIVELSLTVAFRYLQTSTGAAIEEDDMDAPTRGYLWTVSKKEKKPAPTAAGEKTSPTSRKASPTKEAARSPEGARKSPGGRKSPAPKKGTAVKKGATRSGKDKNRNNMGPNNNNMVSQGNYNNMAVDRVRQHTQPAAETLPTSDGRTLRQAPVTRMPSNATVSASRQTSATYVTGSSRQTSGTQLTATSHETRRTNNTGSVTRQQSHDSVAIRSSASTSALRSSATGSNSYASTIRPNMSRNNNVNAAPESTSASLNSQQNLHSDCTTELPHPLPPTQQQQQQMLCDTDVKRPSPPAVHTAKNNVQPTQQPEVPRPLTPIPIPEVHGATMASARLPRSIPLADYRVSPRSSRVYAESININSGSRQTSGHHQSRCAGWNATAMQPPLAGVHKPVVSRSVVGVGTPSNYYRNAPTVQVVPPPLPARNVSRTEESPYVMMYPQRPARNNSTSTKPHAYK